MPALRLEIGNSPGNSAPGLAHAAANANAGGSVALRPITEIDLTEVARFLHQELNSRLSVSTWLASIRPAWDVDAPNHGFMLLAGGAIVGVQLAFYARRTGTEEPQRICNVSALCVAAPYRSHAFRLVTALLAQKGYAFTDLSPSGNVVPLNVRLGFQHLDAATTLAINWPWPGSAAKVLDDPDLIRETLERRCAEIHQDHVEAVAAKHAVIVDGDQSCYVVFRNERRKRLPLFASILYVSRPDILRRSLRRFGSYLLLRHGVAATLLEHRIVGFRPDLGTLVSTPRPRMHRGDATTTPQDYLYSELACIPW